MFDDLTVDPVALPVAPAWCEAPGTTAVVPPHPYPALRCTCPVQRPCPACLAYRPRRRTSPAVQRAYSRAYRQRPHNAAAIKARRQRYYQRNKARLLAQHQVWRQAHRAHVNATQRRYAARPDVRAAKNAYMVRYNATRVTRRTEQHHAN